MFQTCIIMLLLVMTHDNIGNIEFGFGYLVKDYPLHSDNFFELHFIYRGSGYLVIDGNKINLHENVFYISPPNEKHLVKVDKELVFHIIRVTPPYNQMNIWMEFCYLCNSNDGIELSPTKRFEIERIRTLSSIDDDFAKKSAWFGLESILYEIFIPNIQQAAMSSDDKILKLVRYMEQRVGKKIKLEELAALVFLTPGQVSHIFKEEVGISPIEYFIRLKIDAACYLLSKNDFKNREVSEMLSFSDEFHFSKVFKQKTGISPKQFKLEKSKNKKVIIENLLPAHIRGEDIHKYRN